MKSKNKLSRSQRLLIEEFIKKKNEMKSSEEIVLHNYARMEHLLHKKKKSKKKIEEERIAKIKEFHKTCVFHWEYGGPMDYKTGTKCGNMVGDRIGFILDKHNLTITDFAAQSGVSRSSLQRFLAEYNPDIPSVTTLDKIIKALPCVDEDFLYSPENIENWKSTIINGHPEELKEAYFYYDEFRDSLKKKLYDTLVYTDAGNLYRMPPHVADLFVTQIMSVFDTTDALLEYEKKQERSKIYYDLPVFTIEEIDYA